MDVSSPGQRRRELLAIALASGAVLMLEVACTRVLSVVLWYHMAFLVVSLAMLGLGAPGVWFALRPPSSRALPRALLSAGVLVPVAVALIFGVGRFQAYWLTWLVAGSLLPPFLALGSAVVLLLLRASQADLPRYYAADLLGAAVGAALVVPLLDVVPTPQLVVGVAFLPLLAAALLGGRLYRLLVPACGVALAGTLWWGVPYRLTYTKAYDEQQVWGKAIYERWTPTARLVIFERPFFIGNDWEFFWGLGKTHRPKRLEARWLEQDGSAGTPILRFRGSLSEVDHLLADVTSAGYQVRPVERVAVIGGGGGRDILTALVAGAKDVDAIELNPGIVAALRGPFREWSGGVYDLPHVNAIVGEGRSVLSRSKKRYDLIQISMIDSWAATAAGAFALSENNLYTLEAFDLYLSRLSERGMLAATRWTRDFTAFETTRLALIAQEALRRRGVVEPAGHIAIVSAQQVATLMVSARPFSSPEWTQITALCAQRGFDVVYPTPPGVAPSGPAIALKQGGAAVPGALGLDLSPSTDDRPFFFFDRSVFGAPASSPTLSNLQTAVFVTSGLTLLFFLLPFTRWRPPVRYELVRGTSYFMAIGVGFMLIEATLIQRFVLYLGHPSYATTVVLASLLLGAGVGSLCSTRERLRRAGLLGALLAVPILTWGLPGLFRLTLAQPFALRLVLACVLLSGVGFVLGQWLPAGMARFQVENRPWFWAMNGIASVLAMTLSVALSIELGFGLVSALGGLAYLVAFVLLGKSPVAPAKPISA